MFGARNAPLQFLVDLAATDPFIDHFAIEPPVEADAKPRQFSTLQQTINCRRMDPQIAREFIDSENAVVTIFL
jgi:hypothetical protein